MSALPSNAARRAEFAALGLSGWLAGLCILAFVAQAAPRAAVSREAAALRLNPNTATEAELALLPGIGPTLAGAIVRFREGRAAPFSDLADLDAVPRIGPVTLERLRPHLQFSPAAGSVAHE